MKITTVSKKYKKEFNKLATHPLQSWEWGDFREKTKVKVIRIGKYINNKLVETAQVTIHPLPFSNFTVGYFPKGGNTSSEMLSKLATIGIENNCIFIKLEPNIIKKNLKFQISNFKFDLHPSPHPLFPKYTFILDLTQNEEDLLKNMNQKTRYNIKVAKRHNVIIKKDNSTPTFKTYLRLLLQTTSRQHFFAHDNRYHTLMWNTLKATGIIHLFQATLKVKNKQHTLATWIVFLFNKTLYYPYGASSGKFRNVMASNLMMWEVIKWGKSQGAFAFDMWGSLGPKPSSKDPWFGFHRFKKGYGATLTEFVGSFDLILKPSIYKIYNLSNRLRNLFLIIKTYAKK